MRVSRAAMGLLMMTAACNSGTDQAQPQGAGMPGGHGGGASGAAGAAGAAGDSGAAGKRGSGYELHVTGSGALEASAAVVDVTPSRYEIYRDCGEDGLCAGDEGYAGPDKDEANAEFDKGETFLDCGLDRLCPGDDGYTAPDEGEADGKFQAIFLAGFQGGFGSPIGGRPMLGVHDPIDARLLYLKQGEAELLVLTFDVIGLMPKYVNMLKRRIAEDHGIARGAIVVNAVHNHEGPDSMGPWSAAGVAAWWIEPAMENVLSAVGPLLASTAPARLRAAAAYPVSCVDAATGALKTIADCDEPRDESMSGAHDVPLLERDIRDPWIRDMLVSAARLEKAEGGEAIATIVNWSNHPEALADENSLASSDFPGYARRRVEALGGGVGIYWSGAVGGLMTPLRGTAVPAWSIDGQRSSGPDLITEASFDKAISLGYEVGQTASDALQGAATDNAPTLEVETIDFDVPLTAELNLLFTLTTYFDESDKMLVFDGPGCAERGCLRSQVTHVRLGELEILTIPGELFPEYVVGRSASSVSYAGWPTYEFSSVAGLRDVMKGDVPMFVGLANAELGYMMPRGDFLKDGNPYLDGKAPYDHPNHYEESVSPGAAVGDLYCDRARALLGASGPCLGGL